MPEQETIKRAHEDKARKAQPKLTPQSHGKSSAKVRRQPAKPAAQRPLQAMFGVLNFENGEAASTAEIVRQVQAYAEAQRRSSAAARKAKTPV